MMHTQKALVCSFNHTVKQYIVKAQYVVILPRAHCTVVRTPDFFVLCKKCGLFVGNLLQGGLSLQKVGAYKNNFKFHAKQFVLSRLSTEQNR